MLLLVAISTSSRLLFDLTLPPTILLGFSTRVISGERERIRRLHSISQALTAAKQSG
jgi:hypothetical protein